MKANQTGYTQIENMYIQRLMNMPRQRRLELVSELSELTRELTRAGIRKRNPHLTKDQVEKELWKIIYKR